MGVPWRHMSKASSGLLLFLSLSLSWTLCPGEHSQAQASDLSHRLLTASSQATSARDDVAVPRARVLKEIRVAQGSVKSEGREGSEELEVASVLGGQGLEGPVRVAPAVDRDTAGTDSAFGIRSSSNSASYPYTFPDSKPNPPIFLDRNGNSMGSNDVLYKPKGYPSMVFNGRFQKFRTAFDFAWWCNNTWRCYENPDRSIQMSTFWTDKVSGEGLDSHLSTILLCTLENSRLHSTL